ncbi:hypothetical protein [Natrinema ejinorense]|nr:hypothetical protein [Natrinema ejinorense]
MSESEAQKRELAEKTEGLFVDDDGRIRAKMVKNSKGGISSDE